MGPRWDSSNFANVITNQNLFLPLRSTLVLDMTCLDLQPPVGFELVLHSILIDIANLMFTNQA